MRLLLICLLLAASALGLPGNAGPYRLDLTTDPAVIPVGQAELFIRVQDASGKPVEGAKVRALAKMPTMDMGEKEQTARPAGEPGLYRVPAAFAMGGEYVVTISVDGPAGEGTAEFKVATGQSTATSGTGMGAYVAAGVALVALAGLGLWLYRAGHLPPLGTFVNRQVVGGVLLLAVMAGGAYWAVHKFRRPGSMTPLEAQVMEMNLPAPPGTVAVQVAPVKRGSVDVTVRYAGQAVAYQEQPIYPRTEGIVEWMPFYVGDRVETGQTVARLDVSRLRPEQLERAAGSKEAASAVDVARSEADQAAAEVQLAEAERAERQAAVSAAQAKVDQAVARSEAARAQARYRREEVRRSRTLAEAGGLSQEDLQRDEAEAREAEEKLNESFAEVEAARAEVRAARSQELAHHAHVQSVEAARRTREHQVEQAQAQLASAQARQAGAEAQLGYAEVKSSLDGVVTARKISPGVLVQPGEALLEVAQIDPIRLQANVSESDLAGVDEGDPVRVLDRRGQLVRGRVTSVAPAVNASTRQGMVEAVVPNRDARFLPGNLVRLELVTDQLEDTLYVPSEAVQESGPDRWVWVAQPEASGHIAHRVTLKTGPSNGATTAVLSGLEEGQLVITSGAGSLREGDSVAVPSVAAEPAGQESGPTVRITEKGFEPDKVEVAAGKPVKLTFLRTTDATCGTEVTFPDLKLTKKLPLNQPVTVELTPHAGHTLHFTCGMNMLKGQVVVR